MEEEQFYSVRMRASQNGRHECGGKHISGGEAISTYDNLQKAVSDLLEKGLQHTRGKPDFMQVQFEVIEEPFIKIKPLDIVTNEVTTVEDGHSVVMRLLESAGIQQKIIQKVYEQITEYSGARGAIIVDYRTGERLDDRFERGIRVSRMDWNVGNFADWAEANNMPNHSRVKEALVLASKVSSHPSSIAELCWSDDPDYVTGYVASRKLGYQRITKLKELGDEQGCRIFFVDGTTCLDSYIHFLEKQPVFIHWEK
ncbi:6-carboxyhexanoate--CoA ligase [Bacillus marasmi]|uniref:6-carboxyhexanoate--CoA ligase n=1 Tax=Bacillus marasmi TaxID=1926279 RepID=UPI0011C70177|nr:6-carboxyhexanoate--CoA ligase [Bacillus marasmi]